MLKILLLGICIWLLLLTIVGYVVDCYGDEYTFPKKGSKEGQVLINPGNKILEWQDQIDEIDDIIPYIIKVESNGNPNAVSDAGAIGLMQITPIVLKEYNQRGFPKNITIPPLYSYEYLFNSNINILIGEWYLRRLKNHYLKENYTIERMLAAYNGGITRLRRVGYDLRKMPTETKEYVVKIMLLYKGGDDER